MLAIYSGQIGSFSSQDLSLFFIIWELKLILVLSTFYLCREERNVSIQLLSLFCILHGVPFSYWWEFGPSTQVFSWDWSGLWPMWVVSLLAQVCSCYSGRSGLLGSNPIDILWKKAITLQLLVWNCWMILVAANALWDDSFALSSPS